MSISRRGTRVLIVDDDAALRELAARSLRQCGHLVVTAEDAEVALAQAELGRPPYDIVIADVHLPNLNGIELATILLGRRPTQRIVIITGDPDEALARDALSRGPVNYLLKPFALFELQAAVNQALSGPRYAPTAAHEPVSGKPEPTIGTVSAEWLLWVDDRSYAGVGHGDRVARTARVIALALTPRFTAKPLAELEVAAWSHEIGLLAGPSANPIESAWRSAEMLQECGSTEGVVVAVRHMYERWDGTGGPAQLREFQVPGSAQVLAAADAIDHYCAAWIQTGMDPVQAADRAVALVVSQQGTCFNPEIARAVSNSRESIRSICGVLRRAPARNTKHRPARSLPFDLNVRAHAQVMH
ncbi:MAG: response regulator [Gemmatimonadota bacterium]